MLSVLKVCFCLRKLTVSSLLNLMWPWTSCQFGSHYEAISLVLFFCDIPVTHKHSALMTNNLAPFLGLSQTSSSPFLFLASQGLSYFQTFTADHQGHCQPLKWLCVTLWVTGDACLQEGGIEDGVAWSISNACHGCGIGKQYAEVCWLQPSRPTLLSESIADPSYFIPFQHFGYSPSFHTFKQVVHKNSSGMRRAS